MNKAEALKEKPTDNRKPQNPEALRSQEQKVTHDKVGYLQLYNIYVYMCDKFTLIVI